MKNFIFIDGSYFVFYRYFALTIWWKLTKEEDDTHIPSESVRFNAKFRETFVSKIEEFEKKLGIDEAIKIVAKDCDKKNIWRHQHIAEYKGNRKQENDISNIFRMTFQEDLFKKANCKLSLEHARLEADDCIAISTKYILDKYTDAKIWIITSDMDYLQLASDNVSIFDLKFNKLTERKNVFKDSQKNLFCKIVAGDKSDNIPAIFPRCGMKTAEKYFENKKVFEEKMRQMPLAAKNYQKNKTVIDFNEIPPCLQSEFIQKYENDFNDLFAN